METPTGSTGEADLVLELAVAGAAAEPLRIGSAAIDPLAEIHLDPGFDRPLIRKRARAALDHFHEADLQDP